MLLSYPVMTGRSISRKNTVLLQPIIDMLGVELGIQTYLSYCSQVALHEPVGAFLCSPASFCPPYTLPATSLYPLHRGSTIQISIFLLWANKRPLLWIFRAHKLMNFSLAPSKHNPWCIIMLEGLPIRSKIRRIRKNIENRDPSPPSKVCATHCVLCSLKEL